MRASRGFAEVLIEAVSWVSSDEIASSRVLQDAREKVNKEVERCTHTAPKFSKDGRVALLRIDSGYQVHPVICTRWAGTLKGAKRLQMIMVSRLQHYTHVYYLTLNESLSFFRWRTQVP